MRVPLSPLLLAVLCSACVAAPPPVPVAYLPPPVVPAAPPAAPGDAAAPAVSNFQTKVSATDPSCHDYTGEATIDGKPAQLVGRACQQPDGSWKVAEGTTDNPNQYVMVYPAPVYAGGYYPYWGDYWDYPWLWDAGFGFGTSFIFFDRHFHHGGFHHGGFHHGGFHHR